MFGWRRPKDGFGWHQYVRTTIKLRRDARRELAEQLKRDAAERMRAAGAAAAGSAKVAGSAAADGVLAAAAASGMAARNGAQALASLMAAIAVRLGLVLGHVVRQGAHGLGVLGALVVRVLRPGLERLAPSRINRPIAVAGLVALVAGSLRALNLREVESQGLLTIAAGLLLLTLAWLPRLLSGNGLSMPVPAALAVLPLNARRGLAAAALLAAAAPVAWYIAPRDLRLPAMPSLASLPSLSRAEIVEGKASALGADVVRFEASSVRLADIEVPERDQICTRPGNKRWRCGDMAAQVLTRLVGGRSIKCEIASRDAQGQAVGLCRDGEADIAAHLVRHGFVFAASGLISSRYGALEAEAKAQKLGIWGGTPERPAEWRARVWEEAKRRAPSGCPIKGQVNGAARTYVLPWSADYERVRVNAARGGRWFCSEEEAIAAGWKVAGKG